jgi:hypothetical protein
MGKKERNISCPHAGNGNRDSNKCFLEMTKLVRFPNTSMGRKVNILIFKRIFLLLNINLLRYHSNTEWFLA